MSSLGRNVSSGASLACFDDAADEERLGSPYVDATKLPPMPTVDGKGESLPGPLFLVVVVGVGDGDLRRSSNRISLRKARCLLVIEFTL